MEDRTVRCQTLLEPDGKPPLATASATLQLFSSQ